MAEQAPAKKRNKGPKKKGKDRAKSGNDVSSTRFCDLCSEWVLVGTGGDGNWALHESSTKHKQRVHASKLPNARQTKLGAFFTRPPIPAASAPQAFTSSSAPTPEVPPSSVHNDTLDLSPPAAPGADPCASADNGIPTAHDASESAQSVSSSASASDLLNQESRTDNGATRLISTPSRAAGVALLTRLQDAAARLPDSVQVARKDDILAAFCTDPRPAALSAEEGASGMVHNALKYFWGKEPEELRAVVRRGPLGVEALVGWLDICFNDLKVDAALVEGKIKRLIDAIISLCPVHSGQGCDIEASISRDCNMDIDDGTGPDLDASAPDMEVEEYVPDSLARTEFSRRVDCTARTATPSVACPGYEFMPPNGQPAAESYPWALHTKQRPWTAQIDGNKVTLRSHQCTGHARRASDERDTLYTSSAALNVFSCLECAALHNTDTIMGARHRNLSGPHDNVPRQYLTIAQLKDQLARKTEETDAFRFGKLTLERTVASRDHHLDAFKRFVVHIGQDNTPRLHALVAAELRHGSSIFAILDKLLRAQQSALKTFSYSRKEFEQEFLIWKLGGYAAGNIAHRVLGLPSPDATRRFICVNPLRPSAGLPTSSELEKNVGICFPESKVPDQDDNAVVGVTMPADEIKLQPRMRWDSHGNLILGICREHGDFCCLEFVSESEGDAVVKALREGRVHLAVEATVIGAVILTENPTDYSVRPFAISGSCQRETVEQHVVLLKRAVAALRKTLESSKRRLYSIASDGDARRRRAFYQVALYRTVTPSDDWSSIYPLLAPLRLFSLRCGDDDLTMDFDSAHVKKRFRGGLLRTGGVTIDSVTVTPAVVKQHLLDNGMSSLTANTLLAPNDRQDVILMFRLLNAISKLPRASPEHSHSARASRNVLCVLGRIYAHLLKPYKDVSLNLHEQFVHLSALAHLLLGIYSKDKGNFIPVQLYTDSIHMVVNAFFALAKTQRDNPNGKFWLILMGTDGLEKVFGKVRSMIGNDSNADLLQLANRVDAAVKCVQILEENPTWGGQSRRLNLPSMEATSDDHAPKVFDHINPRSWKGDVHVANVRCLTAWNAGRDIAERELRDAGLSVPFNDMESSGGFDVLCPFGNGRVVLSNGELTAGEVDEVDEDEDHPRIEALSSDVPSLYGPPGTTESIAPDLDDIAAAHEAAEQAANSQSSQKGGHSPTVTIQGKPIHKSSWCRHYSQHFASEDSKDRLRRVRGHTQYDAKKSLIDIVTSSSESSDPLPDHSGDRYLSIEDPVLTLLRCDSLVFLALVRVLDIRVSGNSTARLAADLLHEPNVRLGVQIMVLTSVDDCYQPNAPDWEWTGRCITQTAALRSIEGAFVDPIDPVWTQSVRDQAEVGLTYAFASSDLRVYSAKLFARAGRTTHQLPNVSSTEEFPYRLKDGSACFVCEDDVGSLARHRDNAQYCPLRRCNKVFIPGLTGPDLIRHMSAHILHEPSYKDADNPCAFCLSIGGTCSIRFRPGKAKQIDLKNSRCSHLRGITFSKAEKFSERSPCTNVPVRCPLCPNHADAIWKYNLRAHILKVHPDATLELYSEHFEITDEERTLMRAVNKKHPRQSRQKNRKPQLKVSHKHSSRLAFVERASLEPLDVTPIETEHEHEDVDKLSHMSGEDESDSDEHGDFNDDEGREDDCSTGTLTETDVAEDPQGPLVGNDSQHAPLENTHASPRISEGATFDGETQPESNELRSLEAHVSIEQPSPLSTPPSPDAATRTGTDEPAAPSTSVLGRQLRSSGSRKRSALAQESLLAGDTGGGSTCADCDCALASGEAHLACSSPGCMLKYHLACRDMIRLPQGDWFCDDECKDNAGLRRRTKRRKL